ncbi:SLC13 family permease [Spirulina sp. CCNP1310]|nr:SLC13 family permease [Spirulina sp. CCNP1310]MEA5417837.1 SLC13 family permease [Spirulina sp. CCNP1310]
MNMILTLAVVAAALLLFITELLPVDLIAIIIMVSLMVLKLVTPEQGIAGFGNSATITVMAMFILSAGIAKTGAIQFIKKLLIRLGGHSPNRQILAMGLLVGPISAFLNNTAVVAILLPIIEDWCKQQKISVSKVLIPLSYLSILGGMLTLIGTSTNILASGLSAKLGYGEFSIFQFTQLGLCVFAIGLTYLTIFAPRILPDRKSSAGNLIVDDYNLKDYVTEVLVTPQSILVGTTLQASQIQRKFDLDVLEIIRQGTRFSPPLADKVISIGDILVVRSSRQELLKIREQQGLDILPDVKFKDSLTTDLESGEEKMAEVLIMSNSRLVGTTLKEMRFRQRYNLTVLAIRRGAEVVRGRFGRVPLRFGDVLLVQGPKQSFIGLQTTRELLVLEERDVEMMRQNKAAIAILIGLVVVLTAAFDIMPILVSALAGVVLMVLTGCLKPGEIYGAVRWDIIFLLAGLIPLGTAMEQSGATQWIADQLLVFSGNFSGYWLLVMFYLSTALLTEILSNNASVLLMLPIAAAVANTLGLNPFAFMFTAMFAASNSYMTPIGYQTNTMVYGPGGYRFFDFTRIGAPLTCIQTFATPALIIFFYGLQP